MVVGAISSRILTGMLIPSLDRAAVAARTADARRALVETALRALRHRAAHGTFPPAEALEPLPRDPFDGAPIRLRQIDGALVLYSVGPNGRDDAGAESDDADQGDVALKLFAAR